MGQFLILRSRKLVNWNSPVFLKRYFFICSTYTSNKCFFIISNNFKQKIKPWSTILSPSPSPSGTLWTRSRLPRVYLSKIAESALPARAKIRPPCTLKHRVQQEYNSLLTHGTVFLKAICPWIISNDCLQNWSFHTFKVLYPVLENDSEMDTASKSRPRWAGHTRIGNVWEYPRPPGIFLHSHWHNFQGGKT